MKITRVYSLAFVLLFFTAAASYARNEISGIEVKSSGITTSVKFKFSEKVKYNSCILLENPVRLLVDFSGSDVFSNETDSEFDTGLVREIRFEYDKSPLKAKPVSYVIIGLSEMCSFSLDSGKKALAIKINKIGPAAIESPEKSSKVQVKTLEDALQAGIANNPAIRIALDEIKLARLKVWESYRALYPGLTAKYEQTKGAAVTETGIPSFDEKTYGVQMSQSLYYSGKLMGTYKQSRENHEIAKLKYEDVLLGTTFEITKAFYNMVKLQKTYNLFEALDKEKQKDIDASRKRYEMKLSTKIEYLTAENLAKQIQYNKASVEKDLNLAKLNLLQVLNLSKDNPLDVELDIAYKDIDVNLAQSLRLAELKRPDLRISQKELRVSELGKKIGASSNGFKVDLTGFLGKSGGAYENETLNMGEDYSAGIKISKPLGGNTLNTSYMKDKTSPKLGQSSRTESKTGSASLGILDNIKGYSDKLEGEINYKQTQVKLIEAKNNVEKDVRESVFNLEKSILQVKSSKEDVQLAEEEVVAAKSKKDLNLAQISELLSAKIKMANSKKSYYDALAFYNISLAALNKAVGNSKEFTINAGDKEKKKQGD